MRDRICDNSDCFNSASVFNLITLKAICLDCYLKRWLKEQDREVINSEAKSKTFGMEGNEIDEVKTYYKIQVKPRTHKLLFYDDPGRPLRYTDKEKILEEVRSLNEGFKGIAIFRAVEVIETPLLVDGPYNREDGSCIHCAADTLWGDAPHDKGCEWAEVHISDFQFDGDYLQDYLLKLKPA